MRIRKGWFLDIVVWAEWLHRKDALVFGSHCVELSLVRQGRTKLSDIEQYMEIPREVACVLIQWFTGCDGKDDTQGTFHGVSCPANRA